MIALLSPAKNLDFKKLDRKINTSFPNYLDDSEYLISKIKKLSSKQIGKIMNISPLLSSLNHDRYQRWNKDYLDVEKKAAIFAFNGEVYRALNASIFSNDELLFANKHISILSGLYGLLKPLDLIQPYRLEMGVRWKITTKQTNLYKYWSDKLSLALNESILKHQNKTVVNLASIEYSKVINEKSLDCEFVHCQFLDWKNDKYAVVMTWAKLARGQMAKEIVLRRIDDVNGLKDVSFNGYSYNRKMSDDKNLVFTRKIA